MKLHTRVALAVAGVACLLADGAAADDALSGEAFLRGRNSEQQAVLIDDRVYHLGPRSRILGLEGEELALGDLVFVPELESLEKRPRIPSAWVEYDATRVGERLVLNWMQLSIAQEGLDRTRLPDAEGHGPAAGAR